MAIIKFQNGAEIRINQKIKSSAVMRGTFRQTGGHKFDGGKLRYDLIAQDAQEGMVKILTFGANKYGDRNWEKGMAWSRLFAAAMRHLWAWFGGEDNDPESGESHLDHAACCIHMLSAFVKRGNLLGHDDRPIQSASIINKIDISKERGYAAAEYKQPDELTPQEHTAILLDGIRGKKELDGYIGPAVKRTCVTCKRIKWSSGRGPCRICLADDNRSQWVKK